MDEKIQAHNEKQRLDREKREALEATKSVGDKTERALISAVGVLGKIIRESGPATPVDMTKVANAVDRLDKTFGSFIRNYPKLPDIPQPPKNMSVNNLAQIKPWLDQISKTVGRINVNPIIRVAPTPISLPKTDFKPITKGLKDVKDAIGRISPSDLSSLEEAIKKTTDAVNNLSFPTPNYVLPFKKSTDGSATQVILDGSGSVPVTGSVSTGGLTDTQLRATPVPVSTAGDIAHDGVDSGNPVKIGGKVTTTIPTPVANADRTDAQFDEWGRLVTSDKDTELGITTGTTGLRDRLVAQRCTILADSLADGIAGFWTQTTAGGGGIASTGGEGRLTTSTGTTGSAQMVSPNVAYFPGQVAWMNSAIRFGDAGTAGNIRRIGMFTVSGTTPQEGFYFELNGTTLNAVYVKAGSATAVASTSWSRFSVAPFTLDTNYHSFEIRYTANTIWFYVDNILRHQVSGTSSALTTSLTLPITLTNVKTSGASDITFAIRNIGNGRFGEPATRPANPAQSSPLVAVTSTSVLAHNTSRLGATITNEGASVCYLKLGSTASLTSYTIQLAVGSYYEVPFSYVGAIDGITASSTAQLRVTELS